MVSILENIGWATFHGIRVEHKQKNTVERLVTLTGVEKLQKKLVRRYPNPPVSELTKFEMNLEDIVQEGLYFLKKMIHIDGQGNYA